ncbi:hypothetical protein F5Y09DRAFT_320059, partial [Xylaria sp. FL1042]
MSFDANFLSDGYGGLTYDQTVVPTTMVPTSSPLTGFNTVDCGLSFSNDFDPIFNASQAPSQPVLWYIDDWSFEFRRLQMAYYRAQLSLSRQARESPKAQSQNSQANMATLPLQPPPNEDNVRHTGLHCDTSMFSELNPPATPLANCSNEFSQDDGQVEPPIAQPQIAENKSPVNAEGPLGSKSGNETSENPAKRPPDDVPLYRLGPCDSATVISGLRSMENGLRAETTRRISQVEKSRI